jgi:hypothetical protein
MASGGSGVVADFPFSGLSIVWDGIPPDNGSLSVGQFSVTPVAAAVVDEFLGSGESSKSPQSSSICNHNLPRGDLLDSRFSINVFSFSLNPLLSDPSFSINVVWKRAMLSVRGVYVLEFATLIGWRSPACARIFSCAPTLPVSGRGGRALHL